MNVRISQRKLDYAVVATVLALVGCVLIPFWQPGIPNNDDMLAAIYRLHALDVSWQNGIFYPRLASQFAFGYGLPLFESYNPLAYYIAEFFHLAGMGFISATKAVVSLGLVLSGLGMYVYGRILFRSRIQAAVTAIAYAFAPYQLLDIYQRGAFAESLSLALLPWCLLTFQKLCVLGRANWFLACVTCLTASLLIHPLAVFFFPILLVCWAVLCYEQRTRCNAAEVLGAMVLAVGLSLFFWLPAILERGAIAPIMSQGLYDPRSHLVSWSGLVDPAWVFDYWDPQPFRYALVPALIAILSIALSIFQPLRLRRLLIMFAVVFCGALALQLSAAEGFWSQVPLVSLIQFPWRLFAFACLSGAVLIGALPGLLKPLPWRLSLAGLIVLPLLTTSTLRLSIGDSPLWYAIEEGEINIANLNARGRSWFDPFEGFRPIAVNEQIMTIPNGRARAPNSTPAALPLSNRVSVRIAEYLPLQIKLTTESLDPFLLRFHRFYYPGWQVYVDAKPVETNPSGELGLVTAAIPLGKHDVTLRFEDTWVRRIGTILSLASLLIFLGIGAWSLKKYPFAIGLFCLLFAMGAIGWFSHPVISPARIQDAHLNLEDQVALSGFALDKTTYAPGETVHLSLYWLGLAPIVQDYKVFVHLVNEKNEMISQHDGDPNNGYTPTSRWETGELVVDEHLVQIPQAVPNGTYRLLIGMYHFDSMENLRVIEGAQVLPNERAVLTRIGIQSH